MPPRWLCLFPLAWEQYGLQTSREGHGLFVDTQEADAAKAAFTIVGTVFSFLFESDGEERARRRRAENEREGEKKSQRERKQNRKEDHLSCLTKGICIRPALGAEQLL